MKANEKIDAINTALGKTRNLYSYWAQLYGIPSLNLTVYYILYVEGPITQKRITEKYNHPKQTVNNIIKALQKSGEILLEPEEQDKREKKIILTEAGMRRIEKIIIPLLKLEDEVVARLGDTLLEQFIHHLNAYGDVFQEVIEEYEKKE